MQEEKNNPQPDSVAPETAESPGANSSEPAAPESKDELKNESKDEKELLDKIEENEKASPKHTVLTVVGILLCVILVPILVINCILLVTSWTGDDNAIPSIGGYFPMIVLTDSMEGTIDGGDLIICENADISNVQKDDIVTYFEPGSNKETVVTHRAIEVLEEDGQFALQTKGDANNVEDAYLVGSKDFIAIYKNIRIPYLGRIAMFMQTFWGLVVCVIVPLVLLVGYDAIRTRRFNQKRSDEKDKLLAELEELRKLKAQTEANSDKPSAE